MRRNISSASMIVRLLPTPLSSPTNPTPHASLLPSSALNNPLDGGTALCRLTVSTRYAAPLPRTAGEGTLDKRCPRKLFPLCVGFAKESCMARGTARVARAGPLRRTVTGNACCASGFE